MRWGKSVTIVGVLALFVMIWAEQRETRRELRHLADRIDAQIGHTIPKFPNDPPLRSPVATNPAKSDWESSPPYVIEAPDILLIDQTNVAPLPSYQVEPFDVLHAVGKHVLEADPINGLFAVGPDGTIDLGAAYGGAVRVAGLTAAESQRVLQAKVREFAPQAELAVSLAQYRASQPIAGEHMVRSAVV